VDSLRIIIISHTPWDENNSFGNSFSNIFGDKNKYDIANIYCSPGNPNTNICNRFYQITERDIVKSWFNPKYLSGKEVNNSEDVTAEATSQSNEMNKYLSILKRIRLQIFFWIRDFIWSIGSWKSLELNQFILDFNPDLIFLPVYYSAYMNNVGLYTQKIARVKIAGYISDDCYTLKQFSLSPLFWIDRLIKRRYVKKGIDACAVLYVITPKQKQEYEKIFGNKCKVLYKGGNFLAQPVTKKNSETLSIVYTGNIYDGRWRTLELIGKALKKINKLEPKAQLFIYTQNHIGLRIKKRLTIPDSLFLMGGVTVENVKKIQESADILVHVESFQLTERYKSRLSFSTKIVDYLERGRCILAVGWAESGGIEYLKSHDAAYVITSRSSIQAKLEQLFGNRSLIKDFAEKAFKLGKENHQIIKIRNSLYDDLRSLSIRNI
jgi:hypothetical protein